jgi:ferredoxin
MPRETKHLRPVDDVWYGKAAYKEGLIVPEINAKYGSLSSKLKTMPGYARYLVGSLRELFKSVRSIERNPYTGRSAIGAQELAELESYAYARGVSGIRYTPLKERHLFRQSIVLFRNTIVLVMRMEPEEMKTAPSLRSNREVFRTYHALGQAVNRVSDFLRERGFNAQPVPAIGINLNLSLLARDAGFGEFGRHGLLITPEPGPSVRIAAVLTDAEGLPFNAENPHGWIREYCRSCGACVRACPAGAIYAEPRVSEDGSVEHIDYRACAGPFSRQYGCSVCIKECTFFKSDYHTIYKSFLKRRTREKKAKREASHGSQ